MKGLVRSFPEKPESWNCDTVVKIDDDLESIITSSIKMISNLNQFEAVYTSCTVSPQKLQKFWKSITTKILITYFYENEKIVQALFNAESSKTNKINFYSPRSV